MYCRRGHSAWLKSHCHALTVVGQAGGALKTKAFNAACTGWRYCDSSGVDDQTADERQSSRGGRDVVALLVALKSKACTSVQAVPDASADAYFTILWHVRHQIFIIEELH